MINEYVDSTGYKHKIYITYDCKPIPMRCMDYVAVTDTYDGADDAGIQLIATGDTSQAALEELIEQIELSLEGF